RPDPLSLHRGLRHHDSLAAAALEEIPMNTRMIVIVVAIIAVVAFGVGAWLYPRLPPAPAPAVAVGSLGEAGFVRPHSPVLGPVDAPVTIPEFFDPSCEACRAFYPIVKQIMERHPDQVKLVLRYAAFHEGS